MRSRTTNQLKRSALAKKGRKASDESEQEEFVRAYLKENHVVTPPTPAAFACKSLMADLCRFERHALDVINRHGYNVVVTNGAIRLLEMGGKSLYQPLYDERQLAGIVSKIKTDLSCPQDLKIAALIAAAIPGLWRDLNADKFSAEFASAVCRISAAVPDNDAGARLLSNQASERGKKGGSSNKYNAGLQDFINEVVKALAKGGDVSSTQVWQHLVKNYSTDVETVFRDCDSVYTDGDKLCWTDSNAKQKEILRTSLRRYVSRAKSPS